MFVRNAKARNTLMMEVYAIGVYLRKQNRKHPKAKLKQQNNQLLFVYSIINRLFMKIKLLSLTLFLFGFATANAQTWPCTPDPNLTYNGISPEELPNAMAGYEYWSTLSFKIPRDSSIMGIGVTVDSAQFVYATGKPPGFTFYCNTPNCVWPGGAKGCALFNGKVDSSFTDSTAEFPMKIYTLTWYRFTGGTDQFSRLDSATNYVFRIAKYNGIAEFATYSTLHAYPNPTTGNLTIELRDLTNSPGKLQVTDAFGKTIHQQEVSGNDRFLNTINIDLSAYAKGLYWVTLQTDKGSAIRKVMLR
jgi:hypothetical protein